MLHVLVGKETGTKEQCVLAVFGQNSTTEKSVEFVLRINLHFRHRSIFSCIEGRHLRFRRAEFLEMAAGVGQTKVVGVRRQDDNGNIFTVPRDGAWYETLEEAVRIHRILEEYRHKQYYWIEDEEGRRVDEVR